MRIKLRKQRIFRFVFISCNFCLLIQVCFTHELIYSIWRQQTEGSDSDDSEESSDDSDWSSDDEDDDSTMGMFDDTVCPPGCDQVRRHSLFSWLNKKTANFPSVVSHDEVIKEYDE